MIVYATKMFLSNAGAFDTATDAVKTWLCKKTGSAVSIAPGRRQVSEGANIEVAEFEENRCRACSIRFSHPDRQTRTRDWITEVGLSETANGETEATILLQTRDTTTRFRIPDTTRPGVVDAIRAAGPLGAQTAGGKILSLREDDIETFDFHVRDEHRTFPIVQVSRLADGGLPLDADRLNTLLTGIAEVVVIAPETDTFALSNTLGPRFSAYHGAINIMWPMVDRGHGPFIPTSRLLWDEIKETSLSGRHPEIEILERVCHQTNARLAREHLSLEKIQSRQLRAALHAAQQEPPTDPEIESLYRQVDKEQLEKIDELKETVEDLERRLRAEQADREDSQRTIDGLKAHLREAGTGNVTTTSALGGNNGRLLADAIRETATIEECLSAIELLFPDRLVVLESAKSSANKARGFNAPRKAFDLLFKMCTEYHSALSDGAGGDIQAQEIFGRNSFAARESESVERNKRALALRTFTYRGKEIQMMRHLKIGVKDSNAETFRAHFHWDADRQIIVLGHCGKHLPHK